MTKIEMRPFEDAAKPQSDRGMRIKQRDYLSHGQIPVIDQGQSEIGGYTDEKQFMYSGELPVVLFGDHTRAVKFVRHPFAVGADGIKIFRPAADIETRYFYYWLKSAPLPDRGYGRHYQYLRQLSVPVPTHSRQIEIVAEIEKQFSRLDEAVANLKRVKANLKRYKASVLKCATDGSLSADSDKVQEGQSIWPMPTIGDVAQVISGLTKNPKRQELPNKFSYLRVANVYANELRLDEIETIGVADNELQKLLLRRGDMLVVEGNGSKDQIGRVAIWNGEIRDCVHQNHLIKVRFGAEVLPEWALIWLMSPNGRAEIERVSSSTAGLLTLSTGKVRRLPLPLPPVAAQRKLVDEVERRLSLVRSVEAQVNANFIRVRALRGATLKKAFESYNLE